MKNILIAAVLAVVSTTALANDDFVLSGEAGMTSNYVWRGISQSNEDMAAQAGVGFEYGNVFGGVWGSSVDFQDNDQASMELDISGGYRFDLTDNTNVKVGGIYYMYPGASSSLDYDFYELNVGLNHAFDNGAEVGAKISHSPDYFGGTGSAQYYEANGSLPLGNSGFYADAHVGHSVLDQTDDYNDYGVGIGYNGFRNVDFRVGYSDTDINDSTMPIANDQWSVSAKVTF